MSLPLYQVDAFTAEPFTGNPAAVCLLDGTREDAWMQALAAEMNLSETAFLLPREDTQEADYALRWFTPRTEVNLCGHATLVSAHVLIERGLADPARPLRFTTRSGVLSAAVSAAGIELDFPACAPTAGELEPRLPAALGVTPVYTGHNGTDALLILDSADALYAIEPDLATLRALPYRGIIVSAPSDRPEYDFVSRFFAPAVGVDEDPVTGSAHCCLAPYWSERLDRTNLSAYQASARGGALGLRLAGERVRMNGQAVTVFQGELRV